MLSLSLLLIVVLLNSRALLLNSSSSLQTPEEVKARIIDNEAVRTTQVAKLTKVRASRNEEDVAK